MQRYGLEVNGGAEYLSRLYAERLKNYYDVTVLASCAIDHVSWKNEYAPGAVNINGVKVLRFPVAHERDMSQFVIAMSNYWANQERDFFDDLSWMKLNGPDCPALYHYIKENKDAFDAFLFVGYLYYSTTFCMPEVAHKSIFIPTAHDEMPLHECEMFHALFNAPAAIMYLTEEERVFVNDKFGNERIPCVVTGSGIVPPDNAAIDAQVEIFTKNGLKREDDYIVYIGRIEQGKSCDMLFDCFIDYKKQYGGSLKLVLAGKSIMEIPQHDDITWAGFVSEEEKFALIKHAKALVLASHQESLSLVVLEAMTLGIPVVVNANGDVLKGHIDKSDAGLYFYDEEEFVDAIGFMAGNNAARAEMGKNGQIYMKNNYSWDVIDQKMKDIIERVSLHV